MPLTKAEVTRLRSLQDKKHREDAGLFVIEGEKVVGELLAAGYPLREIYATAEWMEVERGLRTRFLTRPETGFHLPTCRATVTLTIKTQNRLAGPVSSL